MLSGSGGGGINAAGVVGLNANAGHEVTRNFHHVQAGFVKIKVGNKKDFITRRRTIYFSAVNVKPVSPENPPTIDNYERSLYDESGQRKDYIVILPDAELEQLDKEEYDRKYTATSGHSKHGMCKFVLTNYQGRRKLILLRGANL